ncbi:MAG TPA: hypothetical protein VEO02_08435 [Thermoanaerobaculia bacterium]|nr:hypothetical protein [Thermoanaerobaculia bacterium]
MNRLRLVLLSVGVLLSSAPAVLSEPAQTAARSGIIRQRISSSSYSVELPLVARGGTPFLRTLVSFTNNTGQNATATYQFSYTCSVAPCSGFFRTTSQTITVPAFGSFVRDDFVDYLNSQGLLQPGANQGALGTLLVTFNNLPSSIGWEANVVGRTYNNIVESNPSQGTVGFGYNASFFFDSAHETLVGFARDTKSAPLTIPFAGKLRSDLGIRNTDICGASTACPDSSTGCMTVDITFYDTGTGQRVGNTLTLADLKPGELRQVSDIWTTANISSAVNSVLVFVDARNPSVTTPTMEGFITIIDGQNTQDAAFFSMLCGDAGTCSSCSPATSTALFLNGNRFKVQVKWTKPDGTSGDGQAVPLTGDTGYFWFFTGSESNVEMVVKVLNACAITPTAYWVFAAGLTNVGVVMTVTDTQTGVAKTYTNSQGIAFAPIQDTNAFSCP